MSNLKKLQTVANKLSILYVEDNEQLRNKAAKFLQKFFERVDLAANGKEGLDLFKNHHYPIIITDIKMPKMDGLTLIKHIKAISPESEVIVMSAFDTKGILLKGIELSVFRFLKKPVNSEELSETLYQALLKINTLLHTKLFYTHLKDVFNHQSAMVCMLQGSNLLLANELFLEFFSCQSIQECHKNLEDLGALFLEHDGFLYNHDSEIALDRLQHNPNRLYHVKLRAEDQTLRHFIVKYHTIPEKEGFGVLSFDDVTELNLLKLFDASKTEEDRVAEDSHKLFSLLEVIQRNSAKIELHNYYKGLSVTNPAVITEIKEDSFVVKTSYIQQKAAQLEQRIFLDSSLFPFHVQSDDIRTISFEKQTIEIGGAKFVESSPIMRKTIRVTLDGSPRVSLFLGENKFHGDIEIEDISLEAIRVRLNAIPAGLERDTEVRLDIVLEIDKRSVIINTEALLLKKIEHKHSFTLVFIFKNLEKKDLIKYITKRQMALIRELKGMQNG